MGWWGLGGMGFGVKCMGGWMILVGWDWVYILHSENVLPFPFFSYHHYASSYTKPES